MQSVNLFEVESSFKNFAVCTQEPELVQQKEVSPSKALLGPNTGRVVSNLRLFPFKETVIAKCLSVRLMIVG